MRELETSTPSSVLGGVLCPKSSRDGRARDTCLEWSSGQNGDGRQGCQQGGLRTSALTSTVEQQQVGSVVHRPQHLYSSSVAASWECSRSLVGVHPVSQEVSKSECTRDHRGQRICADILQQQGHVLDEHSTATLTELRPANPQSNATLNFEQHDTGGIAADLSTEHSKTIEPGRVIELAMLYAELSDWSSLRPAEYVELCATAERTCYPASFRCVVKSHEELAQLTNEGAQAFDSQRWCAPKVVWNGVELRARGIDECQEECCECVESACDIKGCMENAWRSAISMEESWQDGGTWMLYTHLPRRHKQLLQTPSVKCLPYRASVGVSDKGVWHAWIDTWPALGRRKQTEVVEGVVLFTLVANELPECECLANILLQTSPELQHLWLMNNEECKPVRGVPLTSKHLDLSRVKGWRQWQWCFAGNQVKHYATNVDAVADHAFLNVGSCATEQDAQELDETKSGGSLCEFAKSVPDDERASGSRI
eukprot:6048171-Amphidinium_carterae.1